MKILFLLLLSAALTYSIYPQVNIPDSGYISITLKDKIVIPFANIISKDKKGITILSNNKEQYIPFLNIDDIKFARVNIDLNDGQTLNNVFITNENNDFYFFVRENKYSSVAKNQVNELRVRNNSELIPARKIEYTTNKAYLLPLSILSFTFGWYYLAEAFENQANIDERKWQYPHLIKRYESAKVRNMMVGFSFIAVAFINTIIALEPVEVYSTNNGAGIKYSF